jgi:thiamine biosynthesis protein ThiS
MKLFINGAERDFANLATLASLVEQLGMKPDRVAVELNREIVPRDRWNQTSLSDGDRLEIVHFVGGGHERFQPTGLVSEFRFDSN